MATSSRGGPPNYPQDRKLLRANTAAALPLKIGSMSLPASARAASGEQKSRHRGAVDVDQMVPGRGAARKAGRRRRYAHAPRAHKIGQRTCIF